MGRDEEHLNQRHEEDQELQGSEIRVIVLLPGCFVSPIRCRLEKVDIQDTATQYEAISYAWGDALDTKPIVCSGAKQRVTRSLYGALKHLRYADKVRRLWADALCINQTSNSEKNHQVRMMGEVYSRASRVLVWLGEETPKVQGALRSLQKWLRYVPPHIDWKKANVKWQSDSSFTFSESELSSDAITFLRYQQKSFPAIMHLLILEWWSRRWIIQELLRAREAWLVCGHNQIGWDSVRDLVTRHSDFTEHCYCTLMISLAEEIMLRGRAMKQIKNVWMHHYQNFMSLARWTCFYEREQADNKRTLDLEQLLYRAGLFACMNPHDILYSLLGVTQGAGTEHSELLKIDYSMPLSRVAMNLTIYLLYTASYSPLRYFHSVIGTRRNLAPSMQQQVGESEDEGGEKQIQPSWLCSFFDPKFTLRSDLTSGLSAFSFSAGKYRKEKRSISWKLSRCKNILWVNGIVLGRIASIEAPLRVNDNSNFSYSDLALWARSVWSVVQEHAGSDTDPTKLFYELVSFGWQWIDAQRGNRRIPNVQSAQRWLDCVLHEHFSFPHGPSVQADVETADFQGGLNYATTRQLCVTSTGHIGWVPQAAKVGDEICAFFGDDYLYVIGPCGEGYHNLIGPCYIRGLMHGEALELGVEGRWISLY